MSQKLIKLSATVSAQAVEQAVNVLVNKGVIAIPTDTIYGIASLLPNVSKLYDIKGRRSDKPVALCVSDIDNLYKFAEVTVPRSLLHDILPGPVTLVFNRTVNLPENFNCNVTKVGIRIPDHDFVRNLLAALDGVPLALTSANISDTQSSICVDEFENLFGKLDLIIDGGTTKDETRKGSTVIDLSVAGEFSIIRPGSAYNESKKLLCSSKYGLTERIM